MKHPQNYDNYKFVFLNQERPNIRFNTSLIFEKYCKILVTCW